MQRMATSALEDPPDSFVPKEREPSSPGVAGTIWGAATTAERSGQQLGMVLATVLHVGVAAFSLASLFELRDFATEVQGVAQARFDTTVDIAVDPPEPVAEPEPEPEPEPEAPKELPPEAEAPAPTEAPAPAAAEAAEVLTAAPDPSEPLDLTDQGFISGTGDRFAGGVTAATGTANKAVRTATASATGVVGGQGTAKAPPPPAADKSQPAGLPPGKVWSCPFPPEADAENQHEAAVRLVIAVGVDGRATSVSVLSDPGYGFGQAARQCALRRRYVPGRNAAGNPIATSTPPLVVHFQR